jgi:hypothetical protein
VGVAETGDQFLLEDGSDRATGVGLSGEQCSRVIRARSGARPQHHPTPGVKGQL